MRTCICRLHMTESLEELEKKAAEIKRRIDVMKSKSDLVIDNFFEEMSKPGTYLHYHSGSGSSGEWVINPSGKYRKETKRSVILNGQWMVSWGHVVPCLESWNSGGYANEEFKRMIERGEFKLYHTPNKIMRILEKALSKSSEHFDQIDRMADTCKSDVSFEWNWKETKKYCSSKYVKMVVDHFDGLVFKGHDSYNLWNNYFIFRVVDMGDGSFIIRCSRMSIYKDSSQLFTPEYDEEVIFRTMRMCPFDKERASCIAKEIKELLNETELSSVDELRSIKSKYTGAIERHVAKLKDTVMDAVGAKKAAK